MRDKKFAIAVAIIVILAAVLAYVLLIGPGVQGYVVNKQIDAQEDVVLAIMDLVEKQGYVVLSNGTAELALVEYQPPANADSGNQIPTN